jgi:predicted XRE-type DNA-binding protein
MVEPPRSPYLPAAGSPQSGKRLSVVRLRTISAALAGNTCEDIHNSSGNVFLGLSFSPEEAAILQMRADLMADRRKLIKAKKLTQAKAAKLLGVSQSAVSDLVRGKWEKFSLEMLITLATRAGIRVSLKTAA